jgi:hypothetical protein
LTTLQLKAFGEEIDVFVIDGELKTEQRFTLAGSVFLVLHYEITRIGPQSRPEAPIRPTGSQ